MNEGREILGVCPDCRARIRPRDVLIEYRRENGPSCYAECPTCLAVVRPE